MQRLREYWKILGPGFTTGAADDDPSGIATYSQVGASRGFGLIWLSVFTYPLMSVIQEMCARIGLATGEGLAANIRRHYSKKVLYLCAGLLLFANTFNIGANLGAMAESVRLIIPGASFALLVVGFATLSLLLQISVSYRKYAKFLKYLSLILIAYILSAVVLDIDWGEVLRSIFSPSLSFVKEEVLLICAALGTTISPYLFFWQTSQEVEEQISRGEITTLAREEATTRSDIRRMRIDTWSGMLFSNLVMFFIIAASAATLFPSGVREISSAAEAAEALRPFAGEFSFLLFTLGILGTGFLSIPVLAGSASYAISESFGWRVGLFRKFKEASSFYGIIILAVFLGIILNFIGLNPIRALIYSAIINGIIAPIILFLIVRLAGSEQVMGKYTNKTTGNIFGWLTVGVMSLASIGAIVFLIL